MKYVTLGNGVEIVVDIEEIEPIVFTGSLYGSKRNSCPPELLNEAEFEEAEDNAKFWLWDIDNIELPANHRYSIEALDKYREEP